MKDHSLPGFSSVVKLFREISQLQLTRNLDYRDMMSGNLRFKDLLPLMQLEWGWGDGGTSVQELGVWWGFLCPRVSAQKTSVGSTWGWTESLPGAGSALHRWTLLNKLPLHNKLPLNHSIEGVSSSCQRAGIIQEKTTGERRGLKQNFFLKDFNFIYDFFPIARKLSGACLAPDLIRLPPSYLALFSSPAPNCPLLEQDTGFTSGPLALVTTDREDQEGRVLCNTSLAQFVFLKERKGSVIVFIFERGVSVLEENSSWGLGFLFKTKKPVTELRVKLFPCFPN